MARLVLWVVLGAAALGAYVSALSFAAAMLAIYVRTRQ